MRPLVIGLVLSTALSVWTLPLFAADDNTTSKGDNALLCYDIKELQPSAGGFAILINRCTGQTFQLVKCDNPKAKGDTYGWTPIATRPTIGKAASLPWSRGNNSDWEEPQLRPSTECFQ
jgi:hypothetical protein